jgi:ribosomal protein L3 glutamine methyltransferase
LKLLPFIETEAARLAESGVSFGHGTTNALYEAVWLSLWSLGLPLDDLDGVRTRDVSTKQAQAIRTLIDRRIHERVPAAYLTREAWLQGVSFYVDERCIVPRSLIAENLADGDLDDLLGREPSRVLDLCTGNGSLAVLCALAWPEAQVDGADLSAPALEVATINRQRHGLDARITLLQGDGLQAVAGRRYDLIICNPPYVNAQSMASLPMEFQAEPTVALAGGPDGMDFIHTLLRKAGAHLVSDGWLVLEIGHERAHFELRFGGPEGLEPLWLENSSGCDAVLALPAERLQAWSVQARQGSTGTAALAELQAGPQADPRAHPQADANRATRP